MKESINLQQTTEKIESALLSCLIPIDSDSMADIETAQEILKNSPIPEQTLKKVINMALENQFSKRYFLYASDIARSFNVSKEQLIPFLDKAILELLSDGKIFNYYISAGQGKIDSIECLIGEFPEAKELLKEKSEFAEKIQEAFIQMEHEGFLSHLKKGYAMFEIKPETLKKLMRWKTLDSENLENSQEFDIAIWLNDILGKVDGKVPDPLVTRTVDIFGGKAGWDEYYVIEKITKGDTNNLKDHLKKDIERFGVTKAGDVGINQLEQGFSKFRSEIFEPDFDPHILKESKLASSYFKSQIRFTEAEWTGENHSFEDMVDRYLAVHDGGQYEIAPLNSNFTPSEILYVDIVDKSTENIKYSESFLNRFKIVYDDIKQARELYLGKEPLTTSIGRLEEKRIKIIEELSKKIEGIPNEKGKMALMERLEKLKELNLRSLANFQKNFAALATFKELESDLRRVMFVMGFAKNRTQLEKDLNKIDTKKPTLDDITWSMNFVDHIVNKETMGQYFTDNQARNKFRELISVKSFEEELSRFQNQDKIGTLPMKFIPTRGILMEFSGHIADACWADKYEDTIPATFPNFTAVTMVQNPGTKHERLCGSCMLIETENAETGEPLLVIRGLNPIENTINQLSMNSFTSAFCDYVRTLADKTGRKMAIVVDGHSGGACTNRPILFNHFSGLSPIEEERVPVPYSETEFNGYNITGCIYDFWTGYST